MKSKRLSKKVLKIHICQSEPVEDKSKINRLKLRQTQLTSKNYPLLVLNKLH